MYKNPKLTLANWGNYEINERQGGHCVTVNTFISVFISFVM